MSDRKARQASYSAATPMIAQYLEIKAANPDCLLFYRMGDFYELFFEDAGLAAEALGIALTKRGRHDGADIAMCGVPVHAADEYLAQLIRKGFRVAVCEQLEDPKEAKKRGSGAVVRRDVTRLVTPGTLTEDSLLAARAANHLVALARTRGSGADDYALAWADISTGRLAAMPVAEAEIPSELARLEPGEALVCEDLADALAPTLDGLGAHVTALPPERFDSLAGERRLKELFKVSALEAFGAFGRPEIAALGAVVGYVELTQVGRLPALAPPVRTTPGAAMLIDAATRANLELVRTMGGARQGSLIDRLDRTVTAAGARLLAERLAAPSTDIERINRRLDAVTAFLEAAPLRRRLRAELKTCPDMARPLARLSLGRGGPRDLGAIRAGLATALALPDLFGKEATLAAPPAEIAEALETLSAGPRDLAGRLQATLAEELPSRVSDGGFVAAGVVPALDEARRLRDESRRVIAGLEASYREGTGVRALKVRHNNVLGYFVEVPPGHAATLTADEREGLFIHRQTLAGAVRFTTGELAELELAIGEAAGRAQALEEETFAELAQAVVAEAGTIGRLVDALAALDVAAAQAELAEAENYCRPAVRAEPVFEVKGGRHPVVERALAAARAGAFVANDCDLTAGEAGRGAVWLVTGPNMAGKSTFLRQNALIAVMAQAGGYVPAAAAEIGVVDRLFSRVGASDDLAGGRSTFMVEMVETAAILNQAGPGALVILDEIGRGTATFDGLAIAWAALEHLHEVNRCRTLFATHFHELTALTAKLAHLGNVTMRVSENAGEVVFLHEVVPGAADRSYGVQVARLAGLPREVIARAGEVLAALEESGRQDQAARLIDDLPLFRAIPAGPGPRADCHPALERLAGLDADQLTPRQALEAIYELKRLAAEVKV